MATLSKTRAAYQHHNGNIGFRPILPPTHHKMLSDIAFQTGLVQASRSESQYNLRMARLRDMLKTLPKSL